MYHMIGYNLYKDKSHLSSKHPYPIDSIIILIFLTKKKGLKELKKLFIGELFRVVESGFE